MASDYHPSKISMEDQKTDMSSEWDRKTKIISQPTAPIWGHVH